MPKAPFNTHAYAPYITTIVRELLPNGTRNGVEWQVGSLGGESGKSLSICLSGEKAGLWYDFATGEKGNLLGLVMAVLGVSHLQAKAWFKDFVAGLPTDYQPKNLPPVTAKDIAKCQERLDMVWGFSESLQGMAASETPALRYLHNRGVGKAALAAIKATDVLHGSSGVGIQASKQGLSSMVARFDLPNGGFGLHITYLTADGHKGNISPVKHFLSAAQPLKGGAVRLFEPTHELAIAEGIETALAVHQIFDWPVWATCGSQFLAAVEIPPHVQKIFVCVDNDANKAGRLAGEKLAARLVNEGRKVKIIDPADFGYGIPNGAKGFDWLDVLNKNETTQQ